MQCEPRVGFISMTISRHDGQWARINVERSDGESMGFDGALESNSSVFLTIVSDMDHELSWTESIPTQWDLYVPGTSLIARGARIAVPAPPGNSWEFQVNGQYDPADSLDDLKSGPSNWYYDSSTNLIHLRIVGDSNWVTMR